MKGKASLIQKENKTKKRKRSSNSFQKPVVERYATPTKNKESIYYIVYLTY